MSTSLRSVACTALLLAALAAATVDAQQASPPPDLSSLEDLLEVEVESVSGAARRLQRTTEAPASVTVVTSQDIDTFGWRTLADVLRNVRGFHVTYDRNYSYVGVRAFGRPTDYNNRVLVLIDGHRFNDSIYDGALIGTEFSLDLDLVDRIEVIRGPGSALYGTSAFLAVVNVITRRGTHVGGREVGLEAGTFDTYQVRASHGWAGDKGRDVVVSATRRNSRGPGALFFPEFAGLGGNDGWAYNLDGDESTTFFGSASAGGLRLQAVFGEREKRVPTGSWDSTFGDPRYFTRDTRGWASTSYTRDIGATTIEARGYYDHYRYYGDYPGDGIVFEDGAVSDAIGGEASGRRRLGRHLVTVGVEQRTNMRQNQWNGTPGALEFVDRRSSHEVAAYVQDEVSFSSRLTGVFGGRYDWWSLKGGTGRPRLGLVYRTESDTAVKVLYGEAYRAPNLYELYYGGDSTQVPGNSLVPETVRTTELVFERHVTRRVRMTATGYFTRIAGLIDPVVTDQGSVIYENTESVRSTGVEFEAETRWASGLLARGSLAVQRARDGASLVRLSNAPGQLGTLQVAFPLWRRQILMASDSTFTSWRTTVGGDRLPSFWLSNLTATYRPVRWPVVVGASIYNLFDISRADPVGVEFRQASIPQDRRTAALRLTLKF